MNGSLVLGGIERLHRHVQKASLRAIMARWETDLVSFGSLLGPYAGVAKRVVGVGGGASSTRTFFSIFVMLRNINKFSNTLAVTIQFCQTQLLVAS